VRRIDLRSRWIVAVVFAVGLLGTARLAWAGARSRNELVGEWWTEGNQGRIRFVRAQDGTFRGIRTCCNTKQTADNPVRDIHNPNPGLRGRPTVGITIIWGLVYDDGEYSKGYVYNPRDGKTYRMQAELIESDRLRIRGYLAIPLLGKSQVWKRVQEQRADTP
jgi:uncharacterized protein (DUF2147 family)